jgi:hypothetical protein
LAELFANQNTPFPGSDEANESFSKAHRVRSDDITSNILSHQNNLAHCPIPGLGNEDLRRVNFVSSDEIFRVLTGQCKQFVQLFGRIGCETGRSLAALHRAGFIWGTFCDHSQAELHCNAHMDNFVVVPRSVGLRSDDDYQLLAPLDFDMSFA